jgi:hypothetical protein
MSIITTQPTPPAAASAAAAAAPPPAPPAQHHHPPHHRHAAQLLLRTQQPQHHALSVEDAPLENGVQGVHEISSGLDTNSVIAIVIIFINVKSAAAAAVAAAPPAKTAPRTACNWFAQLKQRSTHVHQSRKPRKRDYTCNAVEPRHEIAVAVAGLQGISCGTWCCLWHLKEVAAAMMILLKLAIITMIPQLALNHKPKKFSVTFHT